MAAVNAFVILSLAVFMIFCIGIRNFLVDFEENGCEMTYMFEYPQYVKISLPQNVTKKYSRYGLYAYGEGQFTEKLRHMIFNGVPVLFIPGNSGSHKQVRSLASVSLRKAISSHSRFHFDYFSLDFNEEYSALFGGVLQEQTEFLHISIKRILSLYERSPSKPNSVALVGHSMGGVVARGLFMLPDFNTSLVKVIVTLATPHVSPVLSVDWHLSSYFGKTNVFWGTHRNDQLKNVTFVSLGGGHRDVMVQSALTISSSADINILTTDVPTVWLSTDHLCSLWCKQLVLVLVRAFFDIVDISTKQISDNPVLRKDIFYYHLVHRTGGKRFSISEHPHQLLLSADAEWEEYLQRKLSISEPYGLRGTRHTMVRLVNDEKHHWLTVVVSGLEAKDWIFVCSADVVWKSSRMCDIGVNLSNETVFLPSASVKRKMIHVDLLKLKANTSFTHVVLRLLPTSNPLQLHIDVHSSERHFVVPLPPLLPFSRPVSILPKLTDEKALHYRFYLPDLEKLWQAYLLYIKPVTCHSGAHQAVAKFYVPWNKEAVHKLVTGKSATPLKVKLQSPKPALYNGSKHPHIDLILDASCQYMLSIQPSIADSLGQLVRFYSPQLPAYVATILLLVLRQQIVELSKTGSCVMFHTALGTGGKAYNLFFVAIITSQILRWCMDIMPLSFLKESGVMPVQYLDTDTFLLSSILYMVSFTIVFLMGVFCWAAIILSGQAAHKMALRFLAKTVTGVIVLSDWTLSALSHLPATVAVILLALTFSTCGSLSLCIGLFFFFLMLCKMYEDYLEQLVRMSLHFIAKTLKGATKKKQNLPDRNKEEEKEEDNNIEDKKNKENKTALENTRKDDDKIPEIEHKENDTNNDVTNNDVTNNDVTNNDAAQDDDLNEKKNEKCGSNGNEENKVKDETEQGATPDAKESKDSDNSLSALHFNFTIFIIWLTVCALNVPSALVWAHNYRYNRRLEPDPSLPLSVVLCTCAGFLWQTNVPKNNLKYYNTVSKMLYGLAVFALCYGPLSLYVMSPVLATAVAIVTIHQMFFPSSSSM
ncbi:GPI inositol-deacylase [Schistocerca americana]|uniref:GPI inositol-deacylase n=1 Tax=Schistocerca americana TaxID=7009 RepID=UPI001F504023|nr:GPI inositol-deacylase [Schistocerca americana]XP_049950702.1 GPI inositol-deacylase [Schistocerca serialis cubense]